jgi:alpha-beta hydrolase superfamily lysophospholipase
VVVEGERAPRVVAALGLALLAQGCATPLDPWHTERLTEEFTAADAAEVDSFADYLALEDRLFAQLDTKVYAVTGSGTSYALLRYGSGGAADPRQFVPDWNRSFELRAEAPVGGVLLLHGMSDSPYSLRAIGQALHARGYQVLGLRLPGHGTAPSGLTRVHWTDMAAATHLGMRHLAAELGDKPIHMIGYSTGAALALDFTLDALEGRAAPVPASLVLVSPAVGIHAAAALAAWKRRFSHLPGLGGLGWLVVEPEFDPYKYNSFATNAGEQVHLLTRSVSRRLERHMRSDAVGSFPPTLVLKSNADATVSTEAVASRLLRLLEPHRHELVLFDVNRLAAKSVLKVYDPRALDTRVMGDPSLPFSVVLVTNEDNDSPAAVARRQPPFSADVTTEEPLGLAWPSNALSLSHVALPIPPDDPLYGRRPPENEELLFLGEMAVQGERGMFLLSSDWLLRIRHNPFYAYLESAVVEWMDKAAHEHRSGGRPAD